METTEYTKVQMDQIRANIARIVEEEWEGVRSDFAESIGVTTGVIVNFLNGQPASISLTRAIEIEGLIPVDLCEDSVVSPMSTEMAKAKELLESQLKKGGVLKLSEKYKIDVKILAAFITGKVNFLSPENLEKIEAVENSKKAAVKKEVERIAETPEVVEVVEPEQELEVEEAEEVERITNRGEMFVETEGGEFSSCAIKENRLSKKRAKREKEVVIEGTISVKEAAEEKGYAPATIRAWVKKGKLSCVRQGRVIRIIVDDQYNAIPQSEIKRLQVENEELRARVAELEAVRETVTVEQETVEQETVEQETVEQEPVRMISDGLFPIWCGDSKMEGWSMSKPWMDEADGKMKWALRFVNGCVRNLSTSFPEKVSRDFVFDEVDARVFIPEKVSRKLGDMCHVSS